MHPYTYINIHIHVIQSRLNLHTDLISNDDVDNDEEEEELLQQTCCDTCPHVQRQTNESDELN